LWELACDIAQRFVDCGAGCMHASTQLAFACLQRSLLTAPKDTAVESTTLCYLGELHLQVNTGSFYDPEQATRYLRRAAKGTADNAAMRARIYANLSIAHTALGADREALEAQAVATQAAKDSKKKASGRALAGRRLPSVPVKHDEIAVDRKALMKELETTGQSLPDDKTVKALSRKFNERIENILPSHVIAATWSKLFKDFDNDNSGLLTYDELHSGVRERLKIKSRELPELELKALWVVLDTDDSGFIEASEFQRFMQRDAPPPLSSDQRAELLRTKTQMQRLQQEAHAERELLLDGLKGSISTSEMKAELEAAGVGVPTPQETVELAVWWATRVAEYKPGVHRGVAWLKVFKEVDNDHSGLITFDELKHVVRQSFRMTKAAFSDIKLKQLWCAVDTDESGSIAQVEFGRFVKLAKDHDVGGAVVTMRFA